MIRQCRTALHLVQVLKTFCLCLYERLLKCPLANVKCKFFGFYVPQIIRHHQVDSSSIIHYRSNIPSCRMIKRIRFKAKNEIYSYNTLTVRFVVSRIRLFHSFFCTSKMRHSVALKFFLAVSVNWCCYCFWSPKRSRQLNQILKSINPYNNPKRNRLWKNLVKSIVKSRQLKTWLSNGERP